MSEINDAMVAQAVLGLLLVCYKRRAISHMFHYISISYAAGLYAGTQEKKGHERWAKLMMPWLDTQY